MSTCIALVNQSTSSPLSASITPDWLQGLAAALAFQLNNDLASFWGTPSGGYAVRVSDGTDIASGEKALLLADSGPPDAAGWHDEDGNDVQFGVVDVSLESTLSDLSQTASHEACEMVVNGAINAWRDDGTGREWPQETCDAVESNSYPVTLADGQTFTMSDFVTPDFFDANGSAPFCFLQSQTQVTGASVQGFPPAPFQTAPGGYQSTRSSSNDVTQVWGDRGRSSAPTGRRGRRAYFGEHKPWSRAAKLGVRTAEQTKSSEGFKAPAV